MKQVQIKNQESVIPQHIAIIMDGNRRWAKTHGLPAIEGHRRVANHVLEPLIEHAAKCGIKFVTLWAFSTENWQRDPKEVNGIMRIFRDSIRTFGKKMHEKGIRIRVIGDVSRFDGDIQKAVENLIALTKDNKQITVTFALNYGGRDELLRAMQNLLIYKPDSRAAGIASGDARPAGGSANLLINKKIAEEEFEQFLDTKGIPDPDFIIRTGGEQRLSGFLPWQSVYSELYFPTWYMPEFTPARLDEAMSEFSQRKRRYGR